MEKKTIFQGVSAALSLDSDGLYEEAYKKYLESIVSVGGYLLNQGFPEEEESQKKARRILVVARKSLDRLEVLLQIKNYSCIETTDSSSVLDATQYSDVNDFSGIDQGHLSSSTKQDSLILDSSSSTDITRKMSYNSPLRIPPLEQAQLDNIKLLNAFQTRITRAKDKTVKGNLQLELQRRLSENLMVAKQKQKKYVEEEKKRKDQVKKDAVRKLSTLSTLGAEATPKLYEKQQLLTDILEYEHYESWPNEAKLSLKSCTCDTVEKVILKTFKTNDHPLFLWLQKSQLIIKRKLQKLLDQYDYMISDLPQDLWHEWQKSKDGDEKRSVEEKSLFHDKDTSVIVEENIQNEGVNEVQVKDMASNRKEVGILEDCLNSILEIIYSTLETLIQFLHLIYEDIKKESFDNICYSATLQCLLNPFHQVLYTIFRLVNIEHEKRVAEAMKKLYRNKSLISEIPPALSDTNVQLLNDTADVLRRIPSCPSLFEKMDILVQVSQRLCCIQWQKDSDASLKKLSADELISALVYILVQSGLPQLVSECDSIDKLMAHWCKYGEEGYCLTSFQTALKYLEIQV